MRRGGVVNGETIGTEKQKRYFNEIVVILKRSIDVLIVLTTEIGGEFRIDYSMRLNFQVKTIVNIVTAEVLNIEWSIDE